MIVVAVKYMVNEGFRNEVLEMAKEAVSETRKEKGNIEYTVYPSLENEQEIFVFEVWESMEHLQAHIKSPHMVKFAEARKPFVVEGSYKLSLYKSEPMSL
ncbi:MAG TPA: antibiotic biosynthesis monooxygenase [Clostridiales bacterium]|jgi:quinol monooxygenase YgiN|nr:antibiotic biosynthesis monooxygenase [Clostridiales bacterium]